jgi:hypothetical protein
MNWIVGIDPGNSSGIAVVSSRGELEWVDLHKVAEEDPWPRRRAYADVLKVVGATANECLVVIEDQHLHGSSPKFFVSAMSVIRSASAWSVVAAAMGFRMSPKVKAQTWQSRYGIARNARRWRQRKTQEIVLARYRGTLGGRASRLLETSIDVQVAVAIAAAAAYDRWPDAFRWVGEAKAENSAPKPSVRVRRRQQQENQ